MWYAQPGDGLWIEFCIDIDGSHHYVRHYWRWWSTESHSDAELCGPNWQCWSRPDFICTQQTNASHIDSETQPRTSRGGREGGESEASESRGESDSLLKMSFSSLFSSVEDKYLWGRPERRPHTLTMVEERVSTRIWTLAKGTANKSKNNEILNEKQCKLLILYLKWVSKKLNKI